MPNKRMDTAAEGAAEERRLWIRKLKAMKRWPASSPADLEEVRQNTLDILLEYGEGRTKRNHAKQGGL